MLFVQRDVDDGGDELTDTRGGPALSAKLGTMLVVIQIFALVLCARARPDPCSEAKSYPYSITRVGS